MNIGKLRDTDALAILREGDLGRLEGGRCDRHGRGMVKPGSPAPQSP
jgi:hypothetical protein